MEKKQSLSGTDGMVTPPISAARRSYEVDAKDRRLLLAAVLLGILCTDVLYYGTLGLGVTVAAAGWYGLLFWYGGMEPLACLEHRLLLAAAGLLALSFTLFSNDWLRLWNLVALTCVMALQTAGWTRPSKPVHTPLGFLERLEQLGDGLFMRLGAAAQTAASVRCLSGKKTLWAILLGLVVCVPLLVVVFPLLTAADALFSHLTEETVRWIYLHLSGWMVRIFLGLCLAPFFFSLLYAQRRPEPRRGRTEQRPCPKVNSALPITVLVVMDLLYACFLAVQFAALFGGEAYLARMGICYAEYARSGFFQLVFVALLNLALVLLALGCCGRENAGFRAVQILSSVLVAASGVLLVSAVGRMTLYVQAYGLSFKRALTYWGMAMLAVFLLAALWKIWCSRAVFFKVLFTVSLAGWIILNFANVDGVVAQYNVARGLEPQAVLSVSGGKLAALPALEKLAGGYPQDTKLEQAIAALHRQAEWETSRWETWSVMAQLNR